MSVLKGHVTVAALVLATTFYRRDPYESRLTLTLFFVLTGLAMLTQRRLTWGLIRQLRRAGYNQSFAVVVGSGRVARKAARALRRASWMGIKSIGFVDDNPGPLTSDLDLLGGVADLPSCAEIQDRSCLHRSAHESLCRVAQDLRRADARAGRRAPGGRPAEPGRPVADDVEPRRPAVGGTAAKARILA